MLIDWYTLEKLIFNCSFSDAKKDQIIHRFYLLEDINNNEFADSEKDKIIESLYNNQLDPITHGSGYNQTDIKNHLKKLR